MLPLSRPNYWSVLSAEASWFGADFSPLSCIFTLPPWHFRPTRGQSASWKLIRLQVINWSIVIVHLCQRREEQSRQTGSSFTCREGTRLQAESLFSEITESFIYCQRGGGRLLFCCLLVIHLHIQCSQNHQCGSHVIFFCCYFQVRPWFWDVLPGFGQRQDSGGLSLQGQCDKTNDDSLSDSLIFVFQLSQPCRIFFCSNLLRRGISCC